MNHLIKKFLAYLLDLFNIHPDVLKLIRGSFKLTNPNKAEFPSENLPLASRVIASGMWNYCFFQFYRNFVGPFWVEKQYNPKDNSFIPRATSMLSLNLTHRNWFGFRSPSGSIFSLIDPAGAFTPIIGYYSVELAFRKKNQIFFPNRSEVKTKMELEENLPIIHIHYKKKDLKVHWKLLGDSKTGKTVLSIIEYEVNTPDWELLVSIRPFNSEGGALIYSLYYQEEKQFSSVYINEEKEIILFTMPNEIHFSNLEKGDAYFTETNLKNVYCNYGICTGVFVYSLNPNSTSKTIFSYYRTYEKLAPAQVDLFDRIQNLTTKKRKAKVRDIETHKKIKEKYILRGFEEITTIYQDLRLFYEEIENSKNQWKENLSKKSKFNCSKTLWNKAVDIHSNIVYQLQTEKKITPGVYTYRQFWFRDAAYMLSALSSWNFLEETKTVIESFPKRQQRDGFFKSHEGEWDSTGQAIWTVMDYFKKSHDTELLKELLPYLIKGGEWITKKRKKGYLKKLLPSGFSAEHLGPADYYYWDNLWSIGGLQQLVYACSLFPEYEKYYHFFLKEMNEYSNDFLLIASKDIHKFGVLTASPNRGIDPGIIGSIVDLYPLQLNLIKASDMLKTLKKIYKNYFIKNLFFHPIIHSGFNIYLSLQVAHSFFKLNYVKLARRILKKVLKVRNQLWAYPEAIHPTTLGGVMGDGFHGWASAELILLLKEFVISEYKNTLSFLKGFRINELSKDRFYFGPFPFYGGSISIEGYLQDKMGEIFICQKNAKPNSIKEFLVNIPIDHLSESNILVEPKIPFKILRNKLSFFYLPEILKIRIASSKKYSFT
ncbi:MAG: hypothetical protein ACK4UJ_01250 [Leptonema sp. (in: bacteria)]